MGENWLPKPVGVTGPFSLAWNKLCDYLRRTRLQSSDDISVNQTTQGISLKLKKRIAYGGEPGVGGTTLIAIYDTTGGTAYPGGTIAIVPTTFTMSGSAFATPAGYYMLPSNLQTSLSPTGNMLPQIPTPSSGTVYWWPIPGLVQATTCAAGSNAPFYVCSTSTF